jgi:hypothetical protein
MPKQRVQVRSKQQAVGDTVRAILSIGLNAGCLQDGHLFRRVPAFGTNFQALGADQCAPVEAVM